MLSELALTKFSKLTTSELAFLKAVQAGPTSSVAKTKRVVRAELVRWICIEDACTSFVPRSGLAVSNFKIRGAVDLSFCVIRFPLIFEQCSFDTDVVLHNAKLPYLRLLDCQLKGINLNQAEIDGTVVLRQSVFEDAVLCLGARIKGNLRLWGSRLSANDKPALNLEGASVTRSVLMGGKFAAFGGIRLFGTTVQGNLECSGDVVSSEVSLRVELSTIGGAVLLRRGFRSIGSVRFFDANVGGGIDLQNARLAARKHPALAIMSSNVGRSVVLQHYPALGRRVPRIGEIVIDNSTIGGAVNLRNACHRARRGRGLALFDTTIAGRLIAREMDLAGRLILTRCKIGNDIELHEATIAPRSGAAIFGPGVACKGSVYLDRARVSGSIDLHSIAVAGAFDGEGLEISTNRTTALVLDGAKIGGNLYLPDASLEGRLSIKSASIGGGLTLAGASVNGVYMPYSTIGSNIWLNKAQLHPSSGWALLADHARCAGSMTGHIGFSATGAMSLNFMTVEGHFLFLNAKFKGREDVALRGQSLKVGGGVILANSEVDGLIDLSNSLCGSLNLSGAKLRSRRVALNAKKATFAGSLQLIDGLTACGRLDLARATIAGDVQLGACRLYGRRGPALNLSSAKIEGDVAGWNDVRLLGGLNLASASIAGDVDLSDVKLLNRRDVSLSLRRASVKGGLIIMEEFRANGALDLRAAEVHGIEDDEASWPKQGRLMADGLAYSRLVPLDAKNRLRWLDRQPAPATEANSWQPFEQLAKVLRNQGREHEARRVLIAREEAKRKTVAFAPRRWLLWLYGVIMGFGYEPQRAAIAAPFLIFFTATLFWTGANTIMVPTNDVARKQWEIDGSLPDGYPRFSGFAYSTDVLVPVLSLQQKDAWRPAANALCKPGPRPCGPMLRWWLWFYIAAGWVITTLSVAGFTGLIRKA
ncbi:hypothetical protein [uncultured Caulobacter sp.]|uniref:hypothetical protein n=1 Tax=uncultured Caulobacter sp. TaxID=158749 RepID=UPI00260959FB|nr:hypothetical protein [uncultured Caulobacter sp.]